VNRPAPPLEPLLTTPEVAQILGCDEKTLRALVDDGKLRRVLIGKRIVRFDPADVRILQGIEYRPCPDLPAWMNYQSDDQSDADPAGFIYFVRSGSYVKIGFTTDFNKRLRHLQSGNLHTAHSCGDPACCNPRHIRWATGLENEGDKQDMALLQGGLHWSAKLIEREVLDIRTLLHARVPRWKIAMVYQVSPDTIKDIGNGRTWGWLS